MYVTGTRADYGLMRHTLRAIDRHPDLALILVVTGMHLDPGFGDTVSEVEADGFEIAARVPVAAGGTGAAMAHGIATMIAGFTDAFALARPDLVLLLGDRGEMLAGAIAAIHLNIPVAHIHGGERSGTVDEPVRHAISKLSHLHLTATEEAQNRLVRMGEHAGHVFVVGAPGLVGLRDEPDTDRAALIRDHGLDAARRIALLIYHPVLQEAETGADAIGAILDALLANELQIVALLPNADGGGAAIREVLLSRSARDADLQVHTHFARPTFVAWMAAADVMVGNSSAGIIEAATFGTPVVNIGSRQALRQRNDNVVDVADDFHAVREGVERALALGPLPFRNIYGDGATADRVATLLARVPLGADLLSKRNDY